MVGQMPKPVVIETPVTDQHVCNECRGQSFHVNIFFQPNGDWWFDDIGVWCNDCEKEVDVILPSEMEDE